MSDQFKETLSRIKSHRLPGMDLGEDFIYPNYGSRSILNLPASICNWFGAPQLGAPALDPQIINSLGSEYQNVVLILIDALSLQVFTKLHNAGLLPVWEALIREGVFSPLTSITPSTTASALASLWTGSSPCEHGIIGYEMWLKEYGMVVNSILHSPMSFQGAPGSLEKAGFHPETFIATHFLGSHLSNQGVQAYAYQHHSLARSGLSRMLLRDVNSQPFHTQSDLWVNARHLMEENPGQRKYMWIYWGEVDYMSHNYGPDDERVADEFCRFSATMDASFLSKLSLSARKNTLLVLTADHGQIKTKPDSHFDLRNHPSLVRRLHIMPTGENRLASLYIRPGQIEAVREYIDRTWPGQFILIDRSFAIECDLFGPGTRHPHLDDRLGDLILISRGRSYLWWSPKEDHLLGRHGGMSADEMLVPFIAAEL